MRRFTFACATLVLALIPACSKPSGDVTKTSQATAAAATASAAPRAEPEDPPAPSGSSSADAIGVLFGERFAAEARRRPPGVVTVEQVLGAFKQKGIEVTDVKQHLAVSFHAAYCVGAWVDEKQIGFSVCEYPSDKAVEDGKKDSGALASVTNRTTHQNGRTLFFVRMSAKTPAMTDRVKTMVDAFTALRPTAPPG